MFLYIHIFEYNLYTIIIQILIFNTYFIFYCKKTNCRYFMKFPIDYTQFRLLYECLKVYLNNYSDVTILIYRMMFCNKS